MACADLRGDVFGFAGAGFVAAGVAAAGADAAGVAVVFIAFSAGTVVVRGACTMRASRSGGDVGRSIGAGGRRNSAADNKPVATSPVSANDGHTQRKRLRERDGSSGPIGIASSAMTDTEWVPERIVTTTTSYSGMADGTCG